MVTIVECPRDAMQGLTTFIPTEKKIQYLNALLKVGFDVLDFGSFVSPKAVPQMADTVEVLAGLESSPTQLLAIVANTRGAEQALTHDRIAYLGFPLSVSETFQQRNTGKSISEALETVKQISRLCQSARRSLVVYLSMAFGNPYGETWNANIVKDFAQTVIELGVETVALADTVGTANEQTITDLFTTLIPSYPEVSFGAHFHATPSATLPKIAAAYQAGCKRFDGAIKGYGGCPFANDKLVGNVATETLVAYLQQQNQTLKLDMTAFNACLSLANAVFSDPQPNH